MMTLIICVCVFATIADTYQYQLQALWQKAWATGQGVMQNLRFRERGPFKTWRPETMAEAIMAVLREGLSLSQVKRKIQITSYCLNLFLCMIGSSMPLLK